MAFTHGMKRHQGGNVLSLRLTGREMLPLAIAALMCGLVFGSRCGVQ